MQLEVMCTVSNCHYWSQGNKCHANQILIVSDDFAEKQPDSVDAPTASSAPQTPCNTCMETCCKTFVPKNSDQTTLDGVYRK